MSSVGLFDVLVRRRRVVVFTFVLAMFAVLAGIGMTPKQYTAAVTLRLAPAPGVADTYRLDIADRLMNTYATLVTTGPIQDALRQTLGTESLPSVRVEMPANTELMRIITRHPDPVVAARAANELASILVERSRQHPGTQTPSPLAFTVVEAATAPAAPSWPNEGLLFPAGVVAALLLALGVGFMLERIDPTVYSPDQLAAVAGAPILARVPRLSSRRGRKGPSGAAFRESFRYLTLAVRERIPAASGQVVLVTGCSPGDGASTVAANLATTAANHGARTLVVDCNLRRPAQHELFGVENGAGLSTLLSGRAELRDVVYSSRVRGVSVLPSGPGGALEASLLDASAMREMLRAVADRFDLVVLDTASMAEGADALSLAPHAGGALLVVRRGSVHEGAARSYVTDLEAAEPGGVGLVMNA